MALPSSDFALYLIIPNFAGSFNLKKLSFTGSCKNIIKVSEQQKKRPEHLSRYLVFLLIIK